MADKTSPAVYGQEDKNPDSGFSPALRGIQKMCGAVVAGVMAIGLIYGVDCLEPLLPQLGTTTTEVMRKHREAIEISYQFVEQCKEVFQSLTCQEIQKRVTGRYWNMRDEQELALFIQKQNHNQCGRITGKAARYAAQVILEHGERHL